jgi:transcriptional regulator with XRE-family HTH domain
MKPQTVPPHEVFTAAIRLIRQDLIPAATPQRQRQLDKVARILARARRRLALLPPPPEPPLRPPHDGEDLAAWGQRLRLRRELAELSRKQLARLSGVAASTLRNLERGLHKPTRKTLLRLQAVPQLVGDAVAEEPPLRACLAEYGWQLVKKWRYAEEHHPRLLFICRKAAPSK